MTADSLGSTRLATKGDGIVDTTYDYLPFGEQIGASYPSAPSGPSQKFTGQERDAESGLDNFQARYLSTPQGRFQSPDSPLVGQDPSHPQSWNLYTYVLTIR
jgi:RHS repeat-associated protein